jgi:hypothetical protein
MKAVLLSIQVFWDVLQYYEVCGSHLSEGTVGLENVENLTFIDTILHARGADFSV